MRVLLDENIPVDLAGLLSGHDAQTVSELGWMVSRTANFCVGCRGTFDAVVTMDTNLPHQQNLAVQPFGHRSSIEYL
jgi:hypothetical protein